MEEKYAGYIFPFSGHFLIQPESKTFVFIETTEISKQFLSIWPCLEVYNMFWIVAKFLQSKWGLYAHLRLSNLGKFSHQKIKLSGDESSGFILVLGFIISGEKWIFGPGLRSFQAASFFFFFFFGI